MNLKLVGLMAIPLLGVRVALTSSPSLLMSSMLWLCAGVAILIWIRMLRRAGIPAQGAMLVAIGALSNGLVMLVNGGTMPVHGMSASADAGVWRSADHGGHLLFLADRMSLAGASPGDLLVAAGLLFTFAVMVVRARRAYTDRRRRLAA